MCTIPIRIENSICASYPATVPLIMQDLSQSGTHVAVEMSIPKNVCRTVPITMVATPSVVTSGAIEPMKPLAFLIASPMMARAMP